MSYCVWLSNDSSIFCSVSPLWTGLGREDRRRQREPERPNKPFEQHPKNVGVSSLCSDSYNQSAALLSLTFFQFWNVKWEKQTSCVTELLGMCSGNLLVTLIKTCRSSINGIIPDRSSLSNSWSNLCQKSSCCYYKVHVNWLQVCFWDNVNVIQFVH